MNLGLFKLVHEWWLENQIKWGRWGQKVAEEEKNVTFVKVDIDEEELLAEKYEITAVPTLLVFKNGELVKRQLGFAPKGMIKELLK